MTNIFIFFEPPKSVLLLTDLEFVRVMHCRWCVKTAKEFQEFLCCQLSRMPQGMHQFAKFGAPQIDISKTVLRILNAI
jgi:hypothetical protein